MADSEMNEYIFDEKRNQVRCKFYELNYENKPHAPMYAICTIDEVDFKFEDGEPVERSNKERLSFLKRKRLEKFKELLPKFEEKRRLAEMVKNATEAERHTFQEAIDSYRQRQLPKLKKKTADDYENYLKYWENRLGDLLIAEVNFDRLLEEQDILIETPIQRKDGRVGGGHGKQRSGASVNRYFATLSAVFTKTIIKRHRWTDSNPCHFLEQETESRGRERFLAPEEKQLMFETLENQIKESDGKVFSQSARAKNGLFQGTEPCDPAHLDLAIRIALGTGARQQEVWAMKFKQINFKLNTITFDETKNDYKRTVSIPEHIIARLKRLPSRFKKGYVFPSKSNPNAGYDFRKPFKRLMDECGIKDFTWHCFRHTSASYYAMQGTPIKTMMEIFGWKNEAMVHKYTHLLQEHKKEWMDKIWEEFG